MPPRSFFLPLERAWAGRPAGADGASRTASGAACVLRADVWWCKPRQLLYHVQIHTYPPEIREGGRHGRAQWRWMANTPVPCGHQPTLHVPPAAAAARPPAAAADPCSARPARPFSVGTTPVLSRTSACPHKNRSGSLRKAPAPAPRRCPASPPPAWEPQPRSNCSLRIVVVWRPARVVARAHARDRDPAS
jgi:hypothetical protein